MPPGAACHTLCGFIQKFHGYSLSFRLIRLRISNTAIAAFSFARVAESPYATFVSARPRSHRLRYGFLLHKPAHIVMHTQNPALCDLYAVALQVAPVGGTRSLIRYRSFGFMASGTALPAMKYCSHCRHDTAAGAFTFSAA